MRRLLRAALRLALVLGVFVAVLVLLYRVVPAPGTPLMAIRAAEGEGRVQRWVDLEAISANLRRAVLASEDERFCQHHGFDLVELEAAIERYRAGGHLRGASTITQQTAKNLFLW